MKATNDGLILRAALFEALSIGFRFPDSALVEALESGEFSQALTEIGHVLDFDPAVLSKASEELACYLSDGSDTSASEDLALRLRVEYTGLFIGAPDPKASPYASTWWAEEQGARPLLFVSKRSMDAKRFMRECGMGGTEGRNEPLDHVATICEFMQYLMLALAGKAEAPDGVMISQSTVEGFTGQFLDDWIDRFCDAVQEHAEEPLYASLAAVLRLAVYA